VSAFRLRLPYSEHVFTADPRVGLARLRAAAASGELGDLCTRRGIRLLVAFGSAVRGRVPPRDLDVAVAFEPGADRDVIGLTNDLVSLVGTSAVDVMMLDRAGAVARERALVGTVPLFEGEPGVFAGAQIAAMLERMDTAWLRRLDLETMAR
jgi:predicted nucleotidyltransferase